MSRITLSSMIGYAGIGGFGIGSDLTSQPLATLNWQARDRFFLSAGYRHLHVDYDDDGTGFDVSFSGPIPGLQF